MLSLVGDPWSRSMVILEWLWNVDPIAIRANLAYNILFRFVTLIINEKP